MRRGHGEAAAAEKEEEGEGEEKEEVKCGHADAHFCLSYPQGNLCTSVRPPLAPKIVPDAARATVVADQLHEISAVFVAQSIHVQGGTSHLLEVSVSLKLVDVVDHAATFLVLHLFYRRKSKYRRERVYWREGGVEKIAGSPLTPHDNANLSGSQPDHSQAWMNHVHRDVGSFLT